eukprot:6463578-Amphidinium_carterae.2
MVFTAMLMRLNWFTAAVAPNGSALETKNAVPEALGKAITANRLSCGWIGHCLYAASKSKVLPDNRIALPHSQCEEEVCIVLAAAAAVAAMTSTESGEIFSLVVTVAFTSDLAKSSIGRNLVFCLRPKRKEGTHKAVFKYAETSVSLKGPSR